MKRIQNLTALILLLSFLLLTQSSAAQTLEQIKEEIRETVRQTDLISDKLKTTVTLEQRKILGEKKSK